MTQDSSREDSEDNFIKAIRLQQIPYRNLISSVIYGCMNWMTPTKADIRFISISLERTKLGRGR